MQSAWQCNSKFCGLVYSEEVHMFPMLHVGCSFAGCNPALGVTSQEVFPVSLWVQIDMPVTWAVFVIIFVSANTSSQSQACAFLELCRLLLAWP